MTVLKADLRIKVALILVFLMITAIALVGIVVLKVSERDLLRHKLRASENLINLVINSIGICYHDDPQFFRSNGEFRDLQEIVNTFTKGCRVSEFFVVDENFRIIAHQTADLVGTKFSGEGPKEALSSGQLIMRFEENGDHPLLKGGDLVFSAPLVFKGEPVGALGGKILLDEERGTLAKSQKIIVLYIIFDALFLVVLGSFFLSRYIIKPIKNLIKVTEKVAEGDFNETVDDSAGNEIGVLSSSFNRMSARLKENRGKMEDYVQSLEKMNRDLRVTRQELIRSEKMASVGKLAAGIAHEVGNPIGIILGYVHILMGGVSNNLEREDYLKRIEDESSRIDKIIKELLDYSRPSEVKIRKMDINRIIEGTVSLLSPQKLLCDVRVDLQLAKELPFCPVDEGQLQQVMINLIMNAGDAMPSGGTLTIKTGLTENRRAAGGAIKNFPLSRKNDPPDSDFSRHRHNPLPLYSPWKSMEPTKCVMIEMSDTGVGIKMDDLTKIFDPFYTTKEPGRGVGLGLSICSRIIDFFGGTIKVRSKLGEGTVFTIILPVDKVLTGKG